MRELCRTGDRVRLSFIRALLADAGIDCRVLDDAMGSLFGNAILPRLVVADEDWFLASRLLINTEQAWAEGSVVTLQDGSGDGDS